MARRATGAKRGRASKLLKRKIKAQILKIKYKPQSLARQNISPPGSKGRFPPPALDDHHRRGLNPRLVSRLLRKTEVQAGAIDGLSDVEPDQFPAIHRTGLVTITQQRIIYARNVKRILGSRIRMPAPATGLA
jgi:hypothetical protein